MELRPFLLTALFIGFVIIGCSEKKDQALKHDALHTYIEIRDTVVQKSVLRFDNKNALWVLNDSAYSGFVVSHYPNKSLKEKFGIKDGKKQNQSIEWYPDTHIKFLKTYDNGKLHGPKKIWSSDSLHVQIAQYNFHKGKPHGEQKKWYSTGELYKILNLNMGKEEGLQQAFRKNGDLYANYEARNGRIFGLKKAKLCYTLKDEILQSNKTAEK